MARITVSKEVYTCGACAHEAAGYTKAELKEDGWAWHEIEGAATRYFVMCGVCERAFEARRQLEASVEAKGE